MNKAEIKRNYSQLNNNKTNYSPWILGGIGLIGLAIYFLTRKKGSEE